MTGFSNEQYGKKMPKGMRKSQIFFLKPAHKRAPLGGVLSGNPVGVGAEGAAH